MQKIAYIKSFFDHMVLPYGISGNLEIKKDHWYIIQTRFGDDIGLAKSGLMDYDEKKHVIHHTGDQDTSVKENEHPISLDVEHNKILRPAEKKEIDEHFQFLKEEKEAFARGLKEVKAFELQMKLVNIHILLGRKKIIFNFTSDNRVDFRQLVKKLASVFKTRIEMRQIGVRDAAKIQGGYGVCGEQACCLKSNCHTNSIYLKMSKDQGFVVKSSKLTGLCGRLMCCLAYENDFYLEEKKKYPVVGSYLQEGKKKYRIFSVNIIKDEIFASDENHNQKKFPHDAISFVKKDSRGNAIYELIKEEDSPKPLI